MDSTNNSKNILLIDDDLGIRFVLKKLIFEHFPFKELGLQIYSASEGMEGLGLIFCVKSDVIIIDTTLPKYENREILDYLITNSKITAVKSKVIVVFHKKIPEGLEDYTFLDKTNPDFARNIITEIEKRVTQQTSNIIGKKEKFMNFLGRPIISISEHSTFDHKAIFEDKNNLLLQKLYHIPIWLVEQIFLSFLYVLFVVIAGVHDPDNSNEQKNMDILKLRKRYYTSFAFTLLAVMFIGFSWFKPVSATSYTWDGGGVDNNWNTCANWSTDVCPVAGDTVVFDATSTKDSTINSGFAPTSINAIQINSGYTGTITLGKGFTVTTTFDQADGTFTAANQGFAITGAFGLTSGTFVASSTTTTFRSTFTISGGTFTHNSGTANFASSTATLSCNSTTFNAVFFSSLTGTKTINSDCTLPLSNANIAGTIILNGTLTGTGTLTITTATFNPTAVLTGFTNYSSTTTTVAGPTLNFSGYTAFTSSTALTLSSGTLSLPPTATVGSLTISGGTFNSSSTNLTINSSLNISGSPIFNANSGLVTFGASLPSVLACNNITFNSVTFTNSNTETVNSDCNLPIGSNPTYTNFGTIELYGTLTGTGTISRSGGQIYLRPTAVLSGFTGLSLTTTSTLTVNGTTIDFSSYSPFDINSYGQFAGVVTFPSTVTIPSNLSVYGGTFNAPSTIMHVYAFFQIDAGVTFNNNGGIIDFYGQTSSITCNAAVFNTVTFNNVSPFVKTINNGCVLPIGNNPVLPGPIILAGTLSGTGQINFNAITYNSGAALSGFNDYRSTTTTVSGGSIDLSSYALFTASSGGLTMNSGNFTLPATATSVSVVIGGGTFTSAATNLTISGALNMGGSPIFNANGGTITFATGGAILTCNNSTFNIINFTHPSGNITISSDCSMPLGLNATLTNLGSLIVNGVLSGTGTLTKASGTISMATGSNLSGFSSLALGNLTVSGANLNLSTYSASTITNLTHGSGTVTYPPTLNSTNFAQFGGTIIAPSTNLTVSNAFNLQAGTFTANGGTITLSGSGSVACFNQTLNLVSFAGQTGTRTVGSDCTLPLGNNPTIPNSISLSGVLTGTGLLTNTAGTLTGFSGGSLTGFSSYTGVNMTLTGAVFTLTTFNPVTLSGNLTINSSSAFRAPSGTLNIAGDFIFNGGVFTHNSGTVNLNGGNQNFVWSGATFYNLRKVLVTPSAATLTFVSGTNHTVVGTLTLQGYDASNRLFLRSNSVVQWKIDPRGTRNIAFVDVKDSNNINATTIQAYNTGSVDSTNNTNWNFADGTPNAPSSLGPSNLVDGSSTSDTTPTLSFNLTDPDIGDTVKYTIQISTASDFSAIVSEYTSVLDVQGLASFTVGQIAGSGSYSTGNAGQTLLSGSYYWRVLNTDSAASGSAYTTANGGAVAFVIDTIAPNAFTPIVSPTSPTNDTSPDLSFSTTDNVGIDHYEVQIDGGSFVTQTSVYTLPTQGEGAHTVTVRAFDAAGNFTDGTTGFTIDTTVPNAFTPAISPTSPTNNVTPTVTFSTTDGVGIDHYEVQVDGGSFTTQTSGYVLPTLTDGVHTVVVRAFDTAGNFTDGSAGVTIDTTPPAAFTPIISPASLTNNQTPTLTFSTTDTSGINHYEVQIDGGSYTTQTSPYVLPTLAEGVHSINVAAFDNAGNSRIENVGVTIDLTGAVITFTVPTLVSNSPVTDTTFSVVDNFGINVADVNAIGGSINCTQTTAVRLDCTSIISASGNLTINATDVAGNASSNSSNGYTVDAVAPVVTITAPTKNSAVTITDTTITVTDNFAINAVSVMATGGTILCSQTTSVRVDCTVSISASGDLNVSVTDVAGNPVSKSETGYVIGSTPSSPNPFTPSVNVDPFTINTAPIVTFSTTDTSGIDHYEVKIDGGSFSTQTSPYQLPELQEGFHTITVRAISNSSTFTDEAVSFTIDLTPPSQFVINLNVPDTSNNTSPIATFAAQDSNGIDHYEVKLDDGTFTTQSSPFQLPVLTEGAHTITVKAFDAAGNSTTSIKDFTIDLTAPTGTININNNATETDKKKVELTLTAQDGLSDVAFMIISEDPNFTGAINEPFSLTKEWILSNGVGVKIIYIRYIDSAGNISETYSSKINYLGEAIPVSTEVSRPVETPSHTSENLFIQALNAISSIINDIRNSPIGRAIDVTVPAYAVISSAIVGATAAIVYPNIFIYGFFFVRNRRKYKKFGIVYDVESKSPIPFALVRVYNTQTGLLVGEAPTDLEGKYGFVLDAGDYKITVEASSYQKYVEQLLFDNAEGNFGKNIALSKTVNIGGIITNVRNKLNSINRYIVYAGFLISVIALILNRSPLNFIIVGVYIIQAIIIIVLDRRVVRQWGYVFKGYDEKIKGAFVRIYDSNAKQLEVTMTDERGRYHFDLQDGEYFISADVNGLQLSYDDLSSEKIYVSPAGNKLVKVTIKKGTPIDLRLKLVPIVQSSQSVPQIMNAFGS
ncbi:MAG: hypothetical protein ACMG57_00140 [Candidatus Dojkabacteria bacterium]